VKRSLPEGDKRITPRGWLFPGGRGQHATSSMSMNGQALIEGEAAQKKADLAMRQAETAAWKNIWEKQNAQYQKEHERLAAAGFPMNQAGPPPSSEECCLEYLHSTENMQNS